MIVASPQCCSAPGAYRDRLWRLWRLSEALAPIGAYRRLTIAPIDSGAYPAPIVGAYRRLAPIKYFHMHFLCIHRMSAQQPAQRKATVRGAYQAPNDWRLTAVQLIGSHQDSSVWRLMNPLRSRLGRGARKS